VPAASTRNDRPVDSATQPCPNSHFFELALTLAPEADRPTWWPTERLSGYGGEKVKISGGGIAPPDRELSGIGGLYVSGIPAGTAKVEFTDLLKSVKEALDEECKYEPA
jgi:hypothetical protein